VIETNSFAIGSVQLASDVSPLLRAGFRKWLKTKNSPQPHANRRKTMMQKILATLQPNTAILTPVGQLCFEFTASICFYDNPEGRTPAAFATNESGYSYPMRPRFSKQLR
jgi:hypothetical protein